MDLQQAVAAPTTAWHAPLTEPFAVFFRNGNALKYGFLTVVALTILFALFMLFMPSAHALPAAVGEAFSALQTDFEAMMDVAWPVVGAIATGMWLVGAFLRLVFRM